MAAFTQHTGTSADPLVSALLAGTSGISLVPGSVALNASAPSAIGYYDGALAALGIGAGIIMTSGKMPGTTNTSTSYGVSNGQAGSALIDAVINPVFKTVSYDASTLSFQFDVTDPAATSISFDLVFGSDEFPEWVDQYVDSAVVYVNGVNYAYFNHDTGAPLSVISQNIAAGYFNNNGTGALPIEYDGVSNRLTIVAPIVQGQVNEVTIAISDTGDHILDSGMILSSLAAGTLPGSGVVIQQPGSETSGDDYCVGSSLSEVFDLMEGDDTAYGAGGDDLMSGGAGLDVLDGGSGDDALSGGDDDDILKGGAGDDTASYAGDSIDYDILHDATSDSYSVKALATGSAEGTDTLTGVEKLLFKDGLFALTPGGLTAVPAGGSGPAANTPGALSLTGVAAEGQVLTASVTDVDGIPGAVTYTWQRSANGGGSWTNIGINVASYTVTGDDAGADLRVLVSYTDGLGASEALTSAAKTVTAGAVGDLQITLLNIEAPAGSSVQSPLTTLVARAIDLGLSPNEAQAMVKSVLQLPGDENLLHYDAYEAVIADPGSVQAMTYLGTMLQVTILTSLSDDDTAEGLVVKMIEAWQAGGTLDLSDVDVLGGILGITPDPGGNHPEPLAEILDRCASIFSIVEDMGGLDKLQNEWADFSSVQETIFVGTVEGLITHINQAPTGLAAGSLTGQAGLPVILTAAELLAGFSDPEGSALSVTGLTADQPGTLQLVSAGSWVFTPDAAGPVEFSYTVSDPEGLGIAGSIVMVVDAAANTPPVANDDSATTVVDTPVNIDVLFNDTDADAGDMPVVTGIASAPSTGSAAIQSDGTVTYAPLATWFGTDSFTYTVQDGAGETASATVTVSVDGPSGQTTGPVLFDTAGTQAWDSRFDIFDDSGALVGRNVIYDNGRIVQNGFSGGVQTGQLHLDPTDVAGWKSIERTFDAVTGNMTSQIVTFDDGWVMETSYAGGLTTAQLLTDPDDARTWDTITKTFDPVTGDLVEVTRVNDDGTTATILYDSGVLKSRTLTDPLDARDWREIVHDHDPLTGQVSQSTQVNDNGLLIETKYSNGQRVTQVQTDVDDVFAWKTLTTSFDPATGTRTSVERVYDDGRVFELTFVDGVRSHGLMTDALDAYSWDNREFLYDDTGALVDVIVTPDADLLI